MLSEDVADFLQSGVAIILATVDGELPELWRASGAVVDPDRTTVTLYLPDSFGAAALEKLEQHPRVAAVFTRPSDYMSLQVKGTFTCLRKAGSVDRELQRRYREEFFRAVREVGLVRPERMIFSSSVAIELRVEEVFDQTPGPGAGERR
jgi:hypothetical protein